MSNIVSVTETTDRGSDFSDDLVRDYTRTFRVQTTSPLVGAISVKNAPGIPAMYSSYIFGTDLDRFAFVVNVATKQDQDMPTFWLVTCKYSSKQDKPQIQQNENPLLRAPDVQWIGAEYTRPFVRDHKGRAVVSSAGNTFDPSPETEDSRPVLTITRNEAQYNAGLALRYKDATNSDTFKGAQPNCAKIKFIPGVQQYENGIIFFKVTYEIHFRPEGFLRRVLDQDYRDIAGKVLRDLNNGATLSYPSPLDGDGFPLYIHQRQTITTTPVPGSRVGRPPYLLDEATGAVDNRKNLFLIGFNSVGNAPIVTDGYTVGLPDHYDRKIDTFWTYQLQVEDEICDILKVTQANHFGLLEWNVTVRRGVAGTTAVAHPAGALVKLLPVFLNFQEFRQMPFAPLRL